MGPGGETGVPWRDREVNNQTYKALHSSLASHRVSRRILRSSYTTQNMPQM
jgi:hypothetical protein